MEESPQKHKRKRESILEASEVDNKSIKIDIEEEEEAIEDQDEFSKSDPFTEYFNYQLPSEDISENIVYKSENLEIGNLGRMVHFKPQDSSFSISNKIPQSISEFHVKQNLLQTLHKMDENCEELCETNSKTVGKRKNELSEYQLSFYKLLSNYLDVIYMQRVHSKSDKLRKVFVLHIVNHILKSRAQIIRHNSKLTKNPDAEFRDQGFTRPTAVILAPFRHDAFQIVKLIIALLPSCSVMNRKRFEKEYGPPPKEQRIKKKPPDYDLIFEGNTDEDFKIGIRILNKSITLYSEFYASDLIIGSPLGLRQIIGAEGDKERDFDFLSSVEILIIDRADVLYLQNFVHLLHVVKHFNLLPKQSHDCNFFRVRMYAVQGMAKHFRQTVCLSAVEHRWFESHLFRNFCFNHRGYLSSVTKQTSLGINQIYDAVKVVFRFFDFPDPSAEFDERFEFFTKKVLPDFRAESMAQTLVYVPSYYDFVRLRNHFRENEISAVMLCEYTKPGKVAEGRNNFFKGRRQFMLYTERCHFYNRYHIKGIQHLLFYQPPTYPIFFQEMNFAFKDSNPRREGEEKSCTILASKLDLLQLKGIIGLEEIKNMLSSDKNIFIRYVKK